MVVMWVRWVLGENEMGFEKVGYLRKRGGVGLKKRVMLCEGMEGDIKRIGVGLGMRCLVKVGGWGE